MIVSSNFGGISMIGVTRLLGYFAFRIGVLWD
jgi:hypothetical protein